MLNVDLRPVTAKWHRAYSEGRLNFRADLYGHDRDGITVFEGKGLRPEPEVAEERLPDPINAPEFAAALVRAYREVSA